MCLLLIKFFYFKPLSLSLASFRRFLQRDSRRHSDRAARRQSAYPRFRCRSGRRPSRPIVNCSMQKVAHFIHFIHFNSQNSKTRLQGVLGGNGRFRNWVCLLFSGESVFSTQKSRRRTVVLGRRNGNFSLKSLYKMGGRRSRQIEFQIYRLPGQCLQVNVS